MQDSDNDNGGLIDAYVLNLVKQKARSLVGRMKLTASDREDIEQDLIVDLLERLPKFDPHKASRKTFIARLLQRKISRILRHRMAKRRDFRREEGSLDTEVECPETCKVFLRTNLVNSDDYDIRKGRRNRAQQDETELRLDLETVLSRLPAHLRRACEMLKIMTKADVERALGLTHGAFEHRILRPLREVFTAAGLNEYC